MFQFAIYNSPKTLEEAYGTLVENKNNLILGGTSFLRMGNRKYNTAIDLCNLNLSYIKEENDCFHIGAMTSFRDVETNLALKEYYSGMVGKSLENILGVQFRNNATVGGTVFSKLGFSDFIPVLLSLNTTVVFYKGGELSLKEYLLEEKNRKDILIEIKIKKEFMKCSFQTVRKTTTDYAILNLVLSKTTEDNYKLVLGATPKRALIAEKTSELLNKLKKDKSDRIISEEEFEDIFKILFQEIEFQTNMRGTEEYRKLISKSMLKKALKEVL